MQKEILSNGKYSQDLILMVEKARKKPRSVPKVLLENEFCLMQQTISSLGMKKRGREVVVPFPGFPPYLWFTIWFLESRIRTYRKTIVNRTARESNQTKEHTIFLSVTQQHFLNCKIIMSFFILFPVCAKCGILFF